MASGGKKVVLAKPASRTRAAQLVRRAATKQAKYQESSSTIQNLAKKAAISSSWIAAMNYARAVYPDDVAERRALCKRVDKLIARQLLSMQVGPAEPKAAALLPKRVKVRLVQDVLTASPPKGKSSLPTATNITLPSVGMAEALVQQAEEVGAWAAAMAYARKQYPRDVAPRRVVCKRVYNIVQRRLSGDAQGKEEAKPAVRVQSKITEDVGSDVLQVLIDKAVTTSAWSAAMSYAKEKHPDRNGDARNLCKKISKLIQRKLDHRESEAKTGGRESIKAPAPADLPPPSQLT